jgi:aminoglycoside phosphotransferase (APT) family kinase protein
MIQHMARRRHGTPWSWLRWLIESSLKQQDGFPPNFRLEEKIRHLETGLSHRNYSFRAAGKRLVLRVAKADLSSQGEAIERLRREAKTLQILQEFDLPFCTPELVCLVHDDSEQIVGLIESALAGMPLTMFSRSSSEPEKWLQIIAQVANAVHRLPASQFSHLTQHSSRREHIVHELEALPASVFEQFEAAANARHWILNHLPDERPAAVLHGDLLPQNILVPWEEDERTGVVDWEYAEIGDPAYDLAIVTRGVRKPFGLTSGLDRLVAAYNQEAEHTVLVHDVVAHELVFHLNWLNEAVEARAKKEFGGDGPEHFCGLLNGIVGRASRAARE